MAEFSLKPAILENFEDFYKLRLDPVNIFWSGHNDPPRELDLRNWYIHQLSRTDRKIFLFYGMDYLSPLGYLYIDFSSGVSNVAEISYGIFHEFSGKGFGTELIHRTLSLVQNEFTEIETIIAWIHKDNIASIKIVLKNNFEQSDKTKHVIMENRNKDNMFIEFKYKMNSHGLD